MKKVEKRFPIAAGWLTAFVLWTTIVCFVDVRPIGPEGSSVGLAGINQLVHSLTGVHFILYTLTDWLSLIPIGVCLCFGILGLVQWIKRKSILRVDRSILSLGGFYIATMTVYLFFENFVINYRPVLINGFLEASYPSSTTVLVICVMSTALTQLNHRIRNHTLRRCTAFLIIAFTTFMILSRLFSGVHWISDIIGGLLLSACLVTLYASFAY
ncbi:MAG: phosphatase PAP2 family protein [Clostridia bacterium]|nr:phosphatase PAP2 family protein [Clostridia bacterium]